MERKRVERGGRRSSKKKRREGRERRKKINKRERNEATRNSITRRRGKQSITHALINRLIQEKERWKGRARGK